MALAAITLSSCSQQDDKTIDETPTGSSTITISFEGNASTRVIADAVDASDQVINDASIFVFRPSGVHDIPRKFITGFASGDPQTIAATTAAKTVYVVANIGNEAAHNVMFSTVVDEATLKSLIKDRKLNLYSVDNSAGETDIRAEDVLMTGSGIVSAFSIGSNPTATVDISMKFPLSKIKLIVKDNRINNIAPEAVLAEGNISIVDSRVILIHAGKDIKFFTADAGADQAGQLNFYTGRYGVNAANGFMPYFSNDATSSKAIWATGNDGTAGSATNSVVTHHFYTSANNGLTNPTILAIESNKTSWDETSSSALSEKVYYPIQFTALDAKYTLEPGKSYTVTLTLNGDISGGGGGGVIDPEQPVIDGSITVTVTVAAWEAVTIDKELH